MKKTMSLILVSAVLGLTLTGCAKNVANTEAAKKAVNTNTAAQTTTNAAGKTTLKIGKADFASHGTKSFASVVVAMAGDKIAAVSVDEYQYSSSAEYKGVPNSDSDFGKSYPQGQVLMSKLAESDAYSKGMKEKAKATLPWTTSIDSIRKYVTGKTVAELEATLSKTSPEDTVKAVNAVSSATLTDTQGYIKAIVAAAKNAKENSVLQIDSSQLASLKIGEVDFAPHGTKSFASVVAVMAADKIAAVCIDEYQFVSATEYKGVPNSKSDLGKSFPEGMVLASKLAENEAYSKGMKEKAKATLPWATSIASIEKYATGKTVADLDTTLSKSKPEDMVKAVDSVSSATLTDTQGYLKAVVAAAKAAK